MSRHAAAVVCVLAVTLACSPAPDTLRVERVLQGSATGRFESFDRTIADPGVASDLEALVRALPSAPYRPGAEPFCPIAWGLRYRLSFASGASPTLVATVEGDGCRYAYLGVADRRATTESFWARLAGALGYHTRGSDLFPLPKDARP